MSIDKYLILRKAVELEEINRRILFVSDSSAAFSFDGKGTREYLDNLIKQLRNIEGITEADIQKQEIHWEADSNWKERLNSFRR